MNTNSSYVEECRKSLKIGLQLFPMRSSKNAGRPKIVGQLLDQYIVLKLTFDSTTRGSLVDYNTVVHKYTWSGKPERVSPLFKGPGTDNFSPMWTAIKDFQARLASLEKSLGAV